MADQATDRADSVWRTGEPIEARSDHGCFGCGRLNPCGLRLAFFALPEGEGAGVWAPFTPEPASEGYEGVVHGGIVATVLDEVMAWALYARQTWAVTVRIAVTFRKPVEVGVETRAVGRLVADRGRLLEAAAELRRQADGVLLAEAAATFARVPEAQARSWRDRYLGTESVVEPNLGV
jgi:acyl-coenzyme A thioesterase PaaI-like protein